MNNTNNLKRIKGNDNQSSKGKFSMKAQTSKQKPQIQKDSDASSINSDSSDEIDSDASSDYDNEGNQIKTHPKKKKKGTHHDKNDFAATLAQIISQEPGSTQKPVLSKARNAAAKIDEEKLEYKAKKALAAEKKLFDNKDRKKVDPSTMDYEKKLRSIATRGVIMVFNAIQTQQKAVDLDEVSASQAEKNEVAKMSKASFLSMLKSGAAPHKA